MRFWVFASALVVIASLAVGALLAASVRAAEPTPPDIYDFDCVVDGQGELHVVGLLPSWTATLEPGGMTLADDPGVYLLDPGAYTVVVVFDSRGRGRQLRHEFTIEPCPAPVTRPRPTLPPTDTAVSWAAGTTGTASHVGRRFGRDYLALPEHRWGRPGIRVTICGPADCVTRTSTDAGPDLAMQRAGRVADLNAWDFERVCGCPASRGLVRVTVDYLPQLPPTDTE